MTDVQLPEPTFSTAEPSHVDALRAAFEHLISIGTEVEQVLQLWMVIKHGIKI